VTAPPPAAAPSAEAGPPATIRIDTRRELGRIDRNVYGHFLEANFFGNILGGVFDPDSPRSVREPGVTQGLRRDVIEACRALGLPVVRWPGGNYASAYHWEDGVEPRDRRPRRLELTWGGQDGQAREEDNRFGTDEFLAWCALTGAAPYLNTSARGVEEAVRWVEYTNYAGDTEYTRRRAANGHPAPYGVRYWGIGNEAYGEWQMGHRSAERYAADAREHALFMRKVDPAIRLVAVGRGPGGLDGSWEAWTGQVLRAAGRLVDYLSIHLYGASRHLFGGADEFETTVGQSLYFEEELRRYADQVALEARRAGVDRPLALALDEWNIRHLEPASWPYPTPGDDGGVAPRELPAAAPASRRTRVNRWSPRTAADALFYAGVFHALQRLCGHPVPVTMANTVNLVNANGLLAVRPGGVVRSATYHVWDLLQNHTGPIALHVVTEGPAVLRPVRLGAMTDAAGQPRTRPALVPLLDAAATLSDDRRTLHVSVINRHRAAAIAARLVLHERLGALPPRARAYSLAADATDVLAGNTLAAPDRVALRGPGAVEVAEGHYPFPPHSLTLLSFALA
jgi:alpha-N-arabinofuranosidase